MDDQIVYVNVEDVGRQRQIGCSEDNIYVLPQEPDYRDYPYAKDVESKPYITLKKHSSAEAIELVQKSRRR